MDISQIYKQDLQLREIKALCKDEKLIEALIRLQRLNINDTRESLGSNGVKGVNSRGGSWS